MHGVAVVKDAEPLVVVAGVATGSEAVGGVVLGGGVVVFTYGPVSGGRTALHLSVGLPQGSRHLGLSGGVHDTYDASSTIGRRAASAALDMHLDNVRALVADNLIGLTVVGLRTVERYLVPAGDNFAAGIFVNNTVVHTLIAADCRRQGVGVLIHAEDYVVHTVEVTI